MKYFCNNENDHTIVTDDNITEMKCKNGWFHLKPQDKEVLKMNWEEITEEEYFLEAL